MEYDDFAWVIAEPKFSSPKFKKENTNMNVDIPEDYWTLKSYIPENYWAG